MRQAQDTQGLLLSLLHTAHLHLDPVVICRVRNGEIRGSLQCHAGRVDRNGVRHRAIFTDAASVALHTTLDGILYVGPVADGDPCLQLLPPLESDESRYVLLPISLNNRAVFLVMGRTRRQVCPRLRDELVQLGSRAASALATLILRKRSGAAPSSDGAQNLVDSGLPHHLELPFHKLRPVPTQPQQRPPSVAGAPTGLKVQHTVPQWPLGTELGGAEVDDGARATAEPPTTAAGTIDTAVTDEPSATATGTIDTAATDEPSATAAGTIDTAAVAGAATDDSAAVAGAATDDSAATDEAATDDSAATDEAATDDSAATDVALADPEPLVPRYPDLIQLGPASAHNFFAGFMQEQQTSGVFVATYAPVQLGHRYELLFTLPGFSEPQRALCEVAWSRDYNPEAPDTIPGMGLRFVGLEPATWDRVERFFRQREPIFYEE